ncbi:FkbM family methyltransferase [Pseudomonas sp. REB1044]|uniref:FkbM family methyltransferase n=1 Tax=Pseudomonas sp. REB1044 TaxID=2675224 RepID=UPI00315CDB87
MSAESLEQRLEHLLNEPLGSVRSRQSTTLERLLGGLDRPIVLFGASHLGRKAQAVLKALARAPAAFMDNNPALWGTTIDGAPVYSPAQLAEHYGQALPAVICTIWSGHIHDGMADRLAPLRALGFERIALFGHLAWRYPEQLLPHYCMDLPEHVLGEADAIRRAFALLSDEPSRQLFVDHVQWRLHLDHDLLPTSSALHIYFDAHFTTFREDEVVYDLGAFNGDTLEGYLATGRHYREYHCFEPVSRNFEALNACMQRIDRPGLFAHRMAVGDRLGEVMMEAANGPSSRVGLGDEPVPMTTLDDLAAGLTLPTFIKIDIEGFEPQCLAGAKQLLMRHQPVVAVSVYHEQNHLWRILLQLHEYCADYRYSLCGHVSDGWDLVLYAVPAERVPSFSSFE